MTLFVVYLGGQLSTGLSPFVLHSGQCLALVRGLQMRGTVSLPSKKTLLTGVALEQSLHSELR